MARSSTGLRSAAQDFSLLPQDRSFRDLLLPFALPYFAYVGLGGLLPGLIGPDLAQLVRFFAVAGLLLYFRRAYAFGPRLSASQALLAVAAALAATALWTALLRLDLALPFWRDRLGAAAAADYSLLYFALRTLNSVMLVPVLEEILMRVFVQEAAQSASTSRDGGAGQAAGLFDRHPAPLSRPPLGVPAIAAATLLFALGHDLPSLVPAVAYYLLTTAAYAWTRNFKVVMLIHALTNLAIAALVFASPGFRFLWF